MSALFLFNITGHKKLNITPPFLRNFSNKVSQNLPNKINDGVVAVNTRIAP